MRESPRQFRRRPAVLLEALEPRLVLSALPALGAEPLTVGAAPNTPAQLMPLSTLRSPRAFDAHAAAVHAAALIQTLATAAPTPSTPSTPKTPTITTPAPKTATSTSATTTPSSKTTTPSSKTTTPTTTTTTPTSTAAPSTPKTTTSTAATTPAAKTTPAPATKSTTSPAPAAMAATVAPSGLTVTTRAMTSFTELDITATSNAETLTVSQSGTTISVNAGGKVSTYSGAFGDLFVKASGTSDTITIESTVTISARLYGGPGNDTLNNYTRGQATIVALGGGIDILKGNGVNTSFWADTTDTVNASTTEIDAGCVHKISAFYQPLASQTIPLTLSGQTFAEPTAATTILTTQPSSSFWGTGPTINDVVQGQSSDCYLLASLGAFAYTTPAALRQMAVDLGDGTYAVRFIQNGLPVYVRIDGRLPAGGPYAHGLYYAHPGPSGNQWAPLLEKAYAIYRLGGDSYNSIAIGWMSDVYTALGVANQSFNTTPTAAALYSLLSGRLTTDKPITLATNDSVSGAPVIADHAYTLISAARDAAGNITYVLRNPWGYDGAGNDSNPNDGLILLTTAQLQANFSGGVMGA